MIRWFKRKIEQWGGKYPVGVSRDPGWPETEKAFKATDGNSVCRVCGTKDDLEVHHKKPFHLFPLLEKVFSNLITLCRLHHFLFGHLLDWGSWNENVEEDARTWAEKIRNRP